MRTRTLDISFGLALGVFGAIMIGFLVFVASLSLTVPAPKDRTEEIQQTVREGHAAKLAGVPANANPYIGTSGWAARIWLEGWMIEGKE